MEVEKTQRSMVCRKGIHNWWSNSSDDHQRRMERSLEKRAKTLAGRPVTLPMVSIQHRKVVA